MTTPFSQLTSGSLLKTQFDVLFANSWWLISGQFLLSTTMLVWLLGQLESDIVYVWYFLSLVPPLYRALITHRYLHLNHKKLHYWRIRYLLGSVFYGSVWGILIFNELAPINFYFICFVLGGLMVVTIGSSSIYIPAVISFIFPIAFLVSLKCILLHGEYPEGDWLIAFLLVVFAFLVMLISTRNLNKAIITGLKLRFENLELVHTLKEQKLVVEKAKEVAEKANEDKSRFLAAASHDLRQPLHAMSLFLDAIRHCDGKEERMALYEKLEKSVDSLGELFNALLDISKIDAKVIDIQPTTFYLSELVEKVIQEFELEAKNKNIIIKSRYSNIKIHSDPLWLERIIRNLLSNAIRYTDSGKILLSGRVKNSECLIQVWDTGQGISQEQQGIIFQEFTQLHNPQRDRNNGLGLGLAIVKRLCNLLEHKVAVQSEVGKGSVFTLSVPISFSPIANKEPINPIKVEDSLKNKIILIIDDEPEIRNAMTAMLEKWGCNVLVADALNTAFHLIDKENQLPEIIISDYRLAKNITGLDALLAIKQRYNADIPSVLVTGETETTTIRQINDSGYRVLHKPIRPAKLRMMMNGMVGN